MTEHMRSELRVAQETALYLLAARMEGLSEEDWMLLAQTPVVHRFVGRGRTLVEDREPVTKIRVLCKGWALRESSLDPSRRQILDIVLPGEILGLRVDSCNCATSRVEALTACEVGEIDLAAFQLIMQRSPAFAIGIARHLARELVRAEDHVMRLGRMTAYERVCSLLLEIYVRQRRGFSAPQGGVDFPITQTLLADVLGLSVVHVNRQIMRLRREGAVTLTRRALIVHDERLLAQVCRFQDRLYPDAAEIRLAS